MTKPSAPRKRRPRRRDAKKEAAKFWAKVEKTDTCWLWRGATDNKGYGHFYRGGVYWSAHRYVWTLERGPIEAPWCVCHACDEPRCVRPDHLFLGTHQDNMRDKIAKDRMPTGDRTSWKKLTARDVVAIREMWASGGHGKGGAMTGRAIAARYGVSPATVSLIVSRRNWKHI